MPVPVARLTPEWAMTHVNMSHMNESCHTWMRHVTHEWVMSHMNEACHTWMSHVTSKRVTHEWVMSRTTCSNGGDNAFPSGVSNISMSNVKYKLVMLQVNESCHMCVWVTHELAMSHTTCSSAIVDGDAFPDAVSHTAISHTWLTVSHTAISHTWLIQSPMDDLVSCVYESQMKRAMRVYTRCTSATAMGWLRLVASIKLYVSFAKEPYNRDNILQKRRIIWSMLVSKGKT